MSDFKKKYGQFYTTNSEYIISNLIKDVPMDTILVEPFVGEGDLVKLFPSHIFEMYDIQPKIKYTVERDTLNNPLEYTNKWVITNPPYLAKNKNKDKSLYEKWNVQDLYKAALKSFHGCDGGIVIIPINFFSDEDNEFRKDFLSKYKVLNLNIFEESVFDDTSYTVCSFSFIREDNEEQNIVATLFPKKEQININIKASEGYRIGYEFYNLLEEYKSNGINRLVKVGKNDTPNSDIKLRAIDTGSNDGRIKLFMDTEHLYAKNTERTHATIILPREYTIEEQIKICDIFNTTFEHYRTKYNSLFLTNFRNSTEHYSRKRISFDVAYSLINYAINTL